MRPIILLAMFAAIAIQAPAHAQTAVHCITASWQDIGSGEYTPHFTNNCRQDVTVFFCADRHYLHTCGDTKQYYTHQNLIHAGDTEDAYWIRSSFSWTACLGNVSGLEANRDGSFFCPE